MQTSLRRPLMLLSTVILLALVAASPALFARGAADEAEAQPNVTAAIIDLERLYAESEVKKAGNEQMAAFLKSVEDVGRPMEQQRQQKVAELKELDPNSDRARELRQEIGVLESHVNALQQSGNQEIAFMKYRLELRYMNYARRAVAKVAQDRNVQLVLRKSPPIPESLDLAQQQTANALEAKLAQQYVVYSDPALDITADVLPVLNEMFRQENAGQAQPAAGGQ